MTISEYARQALQEKDAMDNAASHALTFAFIGFFAAYMLAHATEITKASLVFGCFAVIVLAGIGYYTVRRHPINAVVALSLAALICMNETGGSILALILASIPVAATCSLRWLGRDHAREHNGLIILFFLSLALIAIAFVL